MLTYLGTPFRHQGREPGVALDCLGVIVCAAIKTGFVVDDIRTYTRNGHEVSAAVAAMSIFCDPIFVRNDFSGVVESGDIALFYIPGNERLHVAVLESRGENVYMIHSNAGAKPQKQCPEGVVERSLVSPDWMLKLRGVFRVREPGAE